MCKKQRLRTKLLLLLCALPQVSAYTLVAISVDRYIAIMWPLKPRASRHHTKYIIALVWMVAVMTAFPIWLVTSLNQPTYRHQVRASPKRKRIVNVQNVHALIIFYSKNNVISVQNYCRSLGSFTNYQMPRLHCT